MEAYLPNFCYNDKTDIKINGVTVHFVSAINVDPKHAFDLSAIRNMLLDLNRQKNDREFYPFCAGASRVYASYHSIIGRDGEELILVPQTKKAFHAGSSSWKGYPNCNMWMDGTGLAGTLTSGFTDKQYHRLALKCKALQNAYGFPVENIVGHEEIAPSRKVDPGIATGNFDIDRDWETRS